MQITLDNAKYTFQTFPAIQMTDKVQILTVYHEVQQLELLLLLVEEILTNIVPKHVKILIKDVLDGNSP